MTKVSGNYAARLLPLPAAKYNTRHAKPTPDARHQLPARPPHRRTAGHHHRRLRTLGNHRRGRQWQRSEEHTSELQSRPHLVCRLLLEKKKTKKNKTTTD